MDVITARIFAVLPLLLAGCFPLKKDSTSSFPATVWDSPADPSAVSPDNSSRILPDIDFLKTRLARARETSDWPVVLLASARLRSLQPDQPEWENAYGEAEKSLKGKVSPGDIKAIVKRRHSEAVRATADVPRENPIVRGLVAQRDRLVQTRNRYEKNLATESMRATLMDEEIELLKTKEVTSPSLEGEARMKQVENQRAELHKNVSEAEDRVQHLEMQIQEIEARLGNANTDEEKRSRDRATAEENLRKAQADYDLFRWWFAQKKRDPIRSVPTVETPALAETSLPPTRKAKSAETGGTSKAPRVRPLRESATDVPFVRPPVSSLQAIDVERPVLPTSRPHSDKRAVQTERSGDKEQIQRKADELPEPLSETQPVFTPTPLFEIPRRAPPLNIAASRRGGVLYQVHRGDTLPSLAEELYGDSSRWKEIYDANRHAVLRGMLQPGQWILLP